MTGKEKNLIIGAVVVLAVILFYFLMYRPINDDIQLVNSEISVLDTELNELTIEYIKKDKYLDEIETMNAYIERVDESFPAYPSQERMIKTMMDLEEAIETLSIQTYSLDIPTSVLTSGEYKDEETGEVRYKERLVQSSSSLNLETSYEDMKKMLNFIRNYDDKLSIEGLQITSDLVSDKVATTFTLRYFSLMSDSRGYSPEDLFGPFEPKEESIFSPYTEYGDDFDPGVADGELPSESSDIVLNLASIFADRSTVILYKDGDTDGTTYLYADNNAHEPVEIVFDETGGVYTYKYKTTSSSYPSAYGNGIVFTPGNFIDITVNSAPRVDDTDKSGVDISVINNTNLPVEIDVNNEDFNTPRFNVVSTQGTVNY